MLIISCCMLIFIWGFVVWLLIEEEEEEDLTDSWSFGGGLADRDDVLAVESLIVMAVDVVYRRRRRSQTSRCLLLFLEVCVSKKENEYYVWRLCICLSDRVWCMFGLSQSSTWALQYLTL
ncbi:hypothetical protein HanRHA438_Chr10g0433951 [Helianthus annuus]|nr:hypothetical protein HanRHA438_Chr10g0433951 [Helianthus annuus]